MKMASNWIPKAFFQGPTQPNPRPKSNDADHLYSDIKASGYEEPRGRTNALNRLNLSFSRFRGCTEAALVYSSSGEGSNLCVENAPVPGEFAKMPSSWVFRPCTKQKKH